MVLFKAPNSINRDTLTIHNISIFVYITILLFWVAAVEKMLGNRSALWPKSLKLAYTQEVAILRNPSVIVEEPDNFEENRRIESIHSVPRQQPITKAAHKINKLMGKNQQKTFVDKTRKIEKSKFKKKTKQFTCKLCYISCKSAITFDSYLASRGPYMRI